MAADALELKRRPPAIVLSERLLARVDQGDAIQPTSRLNAMLFGLSGTNRERPGLREALAACRAGDTLVVTKVDRLARSLPRRRGDRR